MKTARKKIPPAIAACRRMGFTLVELLVAVALTVMIMTMFAQVFRTASNLITRQKGMAENGQRSRTLTTIIQNDLRRRTFIDVVPYAANETPLTPATRKGYLYYSENSLESDSDDVLQLTIQVGAAEARLFGHATLITGAAANINQPEADDGQVYLNAMDTPTLDDGGTKLPNNLGASGFAEVAYFLRDGNLYRRALLIRQPYDDATPLPTAIDGSTAYPTTTAFWHDFDYSASFGPPDPGPHLHDFASVLENDTTSPNTTVILAGPFYRFGHDHVTGFPREFTGPTTPNFIGRFTHRETSDPVFAYPGALADFDGDATYSEYATDPAQELGMFQNRVSYDPGGDTNFGTSDDLQFDGPRAGEDILLSNVHGFDVKIWDEALAKFVDVGHNEMGGSFTKGGTWDFHATAGITYGPRALADNRVYDTWHPQLDIDPVFAGNDPPPYRPDDGVAPTPVPFQLRAVQITIRFFDVSSNQMKQVTLVQSLIEL